MSGTHLNFKRDCSLMLQEKETMYAISKNDWNRIKRMINGIVEIKLGFMTWSVSCFSICATAIFGLISFYFSENMARWCIDAAWIVIVVTGVLGVVLFCLDRKYKKDITSVSKKAVIDEINSIEEGFKGYSVEEFVGSDVDQGNLTKFIKENPIVAEIDKRISDVLNKPL